MGWSGCARCETCPNREPIFLSWLDKRIINQIIYQDPQQCPSFSVISRIAFNAPSPFDLFIPSSTACEPSRYGRSGGRIALFPDRQCHYRYACRQLRSLLREEESIEADEPRHCRQHSSGNTKRCPLHEFHVPRSPCRFPKSLQSCSSVSNTAWLSNGTERAVTLQSHGLIWYFTRKKLYRWSSTDSVSLTIHV